METIWQDVRFGLRTLTKAPGFAAAAILTLALGIGANTALFSVVNGVVLEPLPYTRAGELVSLYWDRTAGTHSSVPYLNFLDWKSESHSFSSMGAFRQNNMNLTGAGEPERAVDTMVTANFFDLLGLRPILGRTFRREDDQTGAGRVAMLGEGFWKRKFGASRDVLGKTLALDGAAYVIVGVAAGNSPIFTSTDVYTPIGQDDDPTFRDRRASMGTVGIARLKPGMTLEQARADMDRVAENLSDAYPDADKGTKIFVSPLKDDLVGSVAPALLVLLGAVGFVLLIACANVANLLLARSTGREQEFAIRGALGATRGRVIRQVLTESVVLFSAGGALGLAMAAWGTQAALNAMPQTLPRADEIRMDGRVLGFTLGISVLAGLLIGLLPALKISRSDLQATLKEGGRGTSGARHRMQNALVAGEMALALVLLAGAGLMVRSLIALASVKPGFDPGGVLTFGISPSSSKLGSAAQVRQTYRELTERFESAPGVEAASPLVGALPLTGDSLIGFWVTGQPRPSSANDMPRAQWYAVGPDYLKTMGISLKSGRFIGDQDNQDAPFVAVIDGGFARRYFPGENAVGKRINLQIMNEEGVEIVGVVGHVKHAGLGETGILDQRGQIYFSMAQLPDHLLSLVGQSSLFVVRAAGAPQGYEKEIRGAAEKFDGEAVLYDFETMAQVVSDSTATQRFTMILLAAFAALALILSAVGIFGVISYLAGQRTREIGIRMALGAQRGDVLRMMLGQGMRAALAGVSIGLVGALALTRLMASQLYGVRPSDPATFGGVAILLTGVALAACYLPARRAMAVDPLSALRHE